MDRFAAVGVAAGEGLPLRVGRADRPPALNDDLDDLDLLFHFSSWRRALRAAARMALACALIGISTTFSPFAIAAALKMLSAVIFSVGRCVRRNERKLSYSKSSSLCRVTSAKARRASGVSPLAAASCWRKARFSFEPIDLGDKWCDRFHRAASMALGATASETLFPAPANLLRRKLAAFDPGANA